MPCAAVVAAHRGFLLSAREYPGVAFDGIREEIEQAADAFGPAEIAVCEQPEIEARIELFREHAYDIGPTGGHVAGQGDNPETGAQQRHLGHRIVAPQRYLGFAGMRAQHFRLFQVGHFAG